ncbi:MAG: hypothetical protein ACM3X6_01410 [Patescibacteria group bacterium]
MRGMQIVVDAVHIGLHTRRGMVGILRYQPRNWGWARRFVSSLGLRTFGPFVAS